MDEDEFPPLPPSEPSSDEEIPPPPAPARKPRVKEARRRSQQPPVVPDFHPPPAPDEDPPDDDDDDDLHLPPAPQPRDSTRESRDSQVGTQLDTVQDIRERFQDEERFWEEFEGRAADCMTYSRQVEDHTTYFDNMLPSLKDSNKKFAAYRKMMERVVPKGPSSQLAREFSHMLAQLNGIHLTMTSQIQKIQSIREEVQASIRSQQTQTAQFHTQAKAFKKFQKKYFTMKRDGDPGELQRADDTYAQMKFDLMLARYERETEVRTLHRSRGVTMMKHLSQTVEAYSEYFHNGYNLLAPMSGKFKEMKQLTEAERLNCEEERRRRDQVRQDLVQTGVIKHVPLSPTMTGIRDLDRDAVDHSDTSTECEGNLFLPPPNFLPVWCAVKNGMFTINVRDKLGKRTRPPESFPLLLCTVKQNTDLKIRFAMSIVSPSVSHTFLCEGNADMNRWMGVIQNAISSGLNNQMGRSGGGGGPPAEEKKKNLAALAKLAAVPGNSICAECGVSDPDWCSINLGILFCMDCSGVHRNLGVHISKVRSVTLDKLNPALMKYMESMGNDRSNALWEAKLLKDSILAQTKPDAVTNKGKREMFIRAKYDIKEFRAQKPPNFSQEHANKMMYEAAQEGNNPEKIIKAIMWGAEVNWKNPEQELRSALHAAAAGDDLVTIECLLQNDANVRLPDATKSIPLFYAATTGNTAVIQQLMQRGGKQQVVQTNDEDQTPYAVCVAVNGECEASQILQTAMAAAEADIEKQHMEDAKQLELEWRDKPSKKKNKMLNWAKKTMTKGVAKVRKGGNVAGGPQTPTGRTKRSESEQEQDLEAAMLANSMKLKKMNSEV